MNAISGDATSSVTNFDPPIPTARQTPRSSTRAAWLWSAPAIAIAMLAAVVPLANLVVEVVDVRTIGETLTRPSVIHAIRFSTWQAFLSTSATMAIGSTMAWTIAQYEFHGRRVARTLVTVPFVLPTVVVASAFLALLPSPIERGLTSVLLAHIFFNVSVVVRLVSPSWSVLDSNLISAARTLGTSPRQVLTRIIVPVAAPALRSAAALVFLMTFTSYGVVRILGGSGTSTVEVEIYRRAVIFGDVPGGAVLATFQTVVILIVFLFVSRGPSIELGRLGTMKKQAPPWATAYAYVIVGLTALPLVAMVAASVYRHGQWTAVGWSNVFGIGSQSALQSDLPDIVIRSLGFALIAAAIAVPAGIGAAIGLSRLHSRWIRILLVVPLSTSAVAIGFGILITYDSDPLDFRSSWWLLPVVHAAIALPFVVRAALPVVEAIPRALREAASVLGATPWQRWRRIDAPLLSPAVATALGLSTALSLGEFGASSFLTRRRSETLPILIEQLLGRSGDAAFTTAMAASTVLLLLTTFAVVSFDRSVRG